jgi:Fe2+ or Zn2+ uptake regulation protein
MDTELIRIFADSSLRLTASRIAIFTALRNAGTPLSTAQIIKRCPEIDKVSVYRTIKLFSSLHIVTVVTHGWKQSYELASPFHPHHHHIVCDACGKVVELQSPSIESLFQKLAKEHAFMPTSHHFEIRGMCGKCHST